MSNLPAHASLQVAPAERSAFLVPAATVLIPILLWILIQKLQLGLVPLLDDVAAKSWLVVAALTLSLILAMFSIGHVVDLLSHTLLERFLSDKLDGFPHERIVPETHSTPRYFRFIHRKKSNLRRPTFFYEGAKLFVAALSTFFLTTILTRHPDIQTHLVFRTFDLLKHYSVAALIYSLLIAAPALLTGYFPWRTYSDRRILAARIMKRTWRWARNPSRRWIYFKILYVPNFLLAGPLVFAYDLVDKLIRGMFRLNKEIDIETYREMLVVMKKHLGIDFSKIQNNDRYWLPYFSLTALAPSAIRQIQSMRSSATYSRNQAVACLLGSLILSGVYHENTQHLPGLLTRADIMNLSLLLYALGWIFHWRFLQQYYSCTKMTFRAYAAIRTTGGKPETRATGALGPK